MFNSVKGKHQKGVAWGSEVLQEQLNPKMPEGVNWLDFNLLKASLNLAPLGTI
ncbi:hypothetical protein MNV_1250014 [Candidatus Methanoperedens nitroreducens]|uniref:Uncharacterized protein n=1 Tax=Candidatus Methanoperedens nitratireducens TaxID=1392998 RepID=A0A284VK32_9EURY|nr:hypothetical protein MNV_1250014 [Candidatus Methanoperedens nitroreducens]